MPSKRRQINIRLDEETEELVGRLLEAVHEALGLRTVSQADLFYMGLHELAKKYLAEPESDHSQPPQPQ
jgi:hypothetical protein